MAAEAGGVPEVSVIIPAYGRAPELARCLACLAEQEAPSPAWEAIVVDDGSPESLEPVVAGAARAAGSAGRAAARFIRLEGNRGRAAARNAGAREARGRLLLFLDADMLAGPRLLAAHALAHAEAGEAPRVALGPIPVDGASASVLGRYMERRGHMRPRLGAADVPFRYFVSSNTSLARDLFQRVGGYDERYVHYGGEDIDLGYRLHRAGARLVVAPEAAARHAYRYEIGTSARRMREFGRRTLPLVFEKYPELRPVFHLDLLEGRGPLAGAFFRLLAAPPFLAAGRALAPLVGRAAPWILSYVLVGNTFRGYAEYLSARRQGG